jgi:CDP-diacylglycerol--glycerol-3-phosphate 3-phosphatidyltransferase
MISKSCTTTTTRTIISRSRAAFSFSSTSSSSSSYKLQQQEQERQRWIRRCRLLDASRGLLLPNDNDDDDNDANSPPSTTIARTKKRPLPAFPLEARHFGGYHTNSDNKNRNDSMNSLPPNTPKEFHHNLCDMIRNAKERVYIASLYIGPATSSDSKNKDDDDYCEETELLSALSEINNKNNNDTIDDNDNNSKVTVKIILDENRALRPVPIKKKSSSSSSSSSSGSDSDNNNNKNLTATTTSSAEAVARALHRWRGGNSNSNSSSSISQQTSDSDSNSSSLYLFRVLPSTMITNLNNLNWLPNPLDEICGVFHIKIYIIDDQLLLSGANLSSEYFRDRMDRYLHIIQGGNGLVQFYTKLIDILCSHSNEYKYDDDNEKSSNECNNEIENRNVNNKKNRRDEFLREITEHFQDPNYPSTAVTSAQDLFTGRNGAYDNNNDGDDEDDDEKKIVAVGIPTFQAPVGFFRNQYHTDDDDDNYKINTTTIATAKPVSIVREVVSAWSTFWSLISINKQRKDKVDFITDVEATLNLLQEAGNLNNTTNNDNINNSHYSIQLSSAYLNPTSKLISVLRIGFKKIELLTAGTISHGFRPKNKDCNQGSQGTDWTIPSIFQKLVDDCMVSLRQQRQSYSTSNTYTSTNNSTMDARLYHWERPQWTFHAKGIWLREEEEVEVEKEKEDEKRKKYAIETSNEKEYSNNSDGTATTSTTVTSIISDNDDTSEVAAVVVGSSNFGYRSFCRDMESNLILVFPPSSSNSTNNNNDNDYDNGIIARSFGQEWNNLLASSKRESEMVSTPTMGIKEQHQHQQQQQGKNEEGAAATAEKLPPLSWPIRFTIPYIKTFF